MGAEVAGRADLGLGEEGQRHRVVRFGHRAVLLRQGDRRGVGMAPARANSTAKSWVITASPRPSLRVMASRAIPRSGFEREGRTSSTRITALKESPGRTGRSQRSAVMPGEPIEVECEISLRRAGACRAPPSAIPNRSACRRRYARRPPHRDGRLRVVFPGEGDQFVAG